MQTSIPQPVHHATIHRIIRWVNRAVHMVGLGVLVSVLSFAVVLASTVSGRVDTLTNHNTSSLSSHNLQFSLSGGNTWAAGESMQIDFHEDESRFSINGAAVLASDIVINDGTPRTVFGVTVGAANCIGSVGANDVAVGINDTTGVVTFLACPSFVASALGATVQLGIGTVAGGVNRITNPAIAGNYLIDITSGAGDCGGPTDDCSIGLVVVTDSQVAVTAIVGSSGGNAGGGGVNSGDTVPPVISGVVANSITVNSAVIHWDTNEIANSTVHFGVTTAYGQDLVLTSFVAVHDVNALGLSEATTYHFQVCSSDIGNNSACSGDNTFTTSDLTPPVISNVVVSAITETSAVLTWTTNELSNSFVDYAVTAGPPYAAVVTDGAVVTSHSVALTGLTPFTTYHFRVRSADAQGNEAFTTDATFTTVDVTAPLISGVTVTGITTTAAVVNWSTNEPADSQVDFGLSASYGSVAVDSSMALSHAVSLVGLTPNTTYHFKVQSVDGAGNAANTGDFTFSTTLPAPPVISAIVVKNITLTSAIVEWATSVNANSAVQYGLTPAYGSAAGAGALVTAHSVALVGLKADTTYHFSVGSTDVFGQQVFSGDQTFLTLPDVAAPGPVLNLVATPGDTKVQLTMRLPADPDLAGIRIMRTTTTFPTSPVDGKLVFDGVGNSFTDINLINDKTYFYSVFTFDASGNFSGPVSVSATPTGIVLLPLACTDSDGGLNFEIKGNVTTDSGVFDDRCIDRGTVEEESCVAGLRQIDAHDCGAGFVCADGRCAAQALVPTIAVCGNGVCESNESAASCLIDCPVVPQIPAVEVPVSTVSPVEKLSASDLIIYAAGKTVRLTMKDSVVESYPGLTLTVVIPDVAIPRPIRTAVTNFLGRAFAMFETNSYETTIPVPQVLGPQTITAVVNYVDGATDSTDATVLSVARPRVLTPDGVPVAGVNVELLHQVNGSFVTWSAAQFNQTNPAQSAADGSFGFVVPAGVYKIRVSKTGYLTNVTAAFNQTSAIIAGDVTIVPLPLPNLLSQVKFFGQVTATAIDNVRNDVLLQEQTKSVALPISTGVAVVNVVAAGAATASLVPYLAYLLSFFTQPFVFVGRRRRKQWGVIYNSLSKLPIDLATVRLLDATTGRVVRSMVTDKNGRYFFIVGPGTYKISVIKVGFVYPTTLLASTKADDEFADIYHGEVIALTEPGTIMMNVPVDPVVADKTVSQLRREKLARAFSRWVAVGAIAVSMLVAAVFPSWLTVVMVAVNWLLFVVSRRLVTLRNIKNWGVVRDEAGKPVGQVLARVFDTRFNKLLETQVTDNQGRYSFLVGNNTYLVTYDKPGFAEEQRGPVAPSIFTSKKQTQTFISLDVVLKKT